MTEFHFLRPAWLLALIPLAVLYWSARRRRLAAGDWSLICDEALLPHMLIHLPGSLSGARLRPEWLFGAAMLVILALAGPTWERLPTPAFRNDQALVIVLDLSPAMDAQDISPSRIERARYKVADILHGRKDGQNALVVYGNDAFTVTPLTDDGATIISQLSALGTSLLPGEAGGHPETGLERAQDLLKQAGLIHGDILLISSGTGADQAVDVAARIRDAGTRVSVLGTGTAAGGPVPLPRGGFRQDAAGAIWVPPLEAAALQRVASAGGGIFQTVSSDDGDLGALLPFFEQRDASSARPGTASMMLEQWQEQGPWLLIPVIPLAALAFRRGYIAAWLLAALLHAPQPAQALDWQSLFLTRDQQGRKAYEQKDYERAAELFENAEWKAVAQYKAQQAELAAKTLQGAKSTDALYNRGNAEAKSGKLKEAIKTYEEVLKRDPSHQDAKDNKQIVEAALKKQKQQQGSGDDQDKQDEKQDDQQESESNQQQQPKDQPSEQQQSEQKEGEQQRDSSQAEQARAGEERDTEEKPQPQEGEKPQQEEKEQKPGEMKQAQSQPEDGQKPEEQQPKEAAGVRITEDEQAAEQWLRRIPDDPGGLLKRKFQYQYQQRQRQRR